jgi:DNA-binding XRE family transcriptional regulator
MLPLTSTQIHTRPASALVAAIRDRHGLTQAQCAASVGVTRRAWIGYETTDQAMQLGLGHALAGP